MKKQIALFAALIASHTTGMSVASAQETAAKEALCIAEARAITACSGVTSQQQAYAPQGICSSRVAKAPLMSLAAMKAKVASDSRAPAASSVDARTTSLAAAGYAPAVQRKAALQAKAVEDARTRSCVAQKLVQAKLIPQP
jgi:hypothetical protein